MILNTAAKVSFGSNASLSRCARYVRSSPNFRHDVAGPRTSKWAKNDLSYCSKHDPLARTRGAGSGFYTLRPVALYLRGSISKVGLLSISSMVYLAFTPFKCIQSVLTLDNASKTGCALFPSSSMYAGS